MNYEIRTKISGKIFFAVKSFPSVTKTRPLYLWFPRRAARIPRDPRPVARGFVDIFLSYLLTTWCRVLLEQLTGLQLVKKFPVFHGTRMFITALTSVRHLSLSWASPIQSINPHPTSWRSILILSTRPRLGLPSGLLPSGFPSKTLYTPSPHPYAPHAQPISFFSILSPAQYWVRSTNHLAPRYAIFLSWILWSLLEFFIKGTIFAKNNYFYKKILRLWSKKFLIWPSEYMTGETSCTHETRDGRFS